MSSPHDAPASPSNHGRWSSNNRNLIIALAAVSLIAIVAPLLVYFLAGSSDESAQVDVVPEAVATSTPDPLATAGPDATDTPVAVAPAPTAVPTTSGSAAPPAATTAPVVQELTAQAPSVYRVTGVAAGSSVNVRQSAGTTNPLLGTIASNATGIAGTGRRVQVDGSEWREIRFQDGTGWVFAGYLALAPAPAPTATTTSAGPASTVTPVPTAAVVVSDLATESPALYSVTGVAAGASVNVRVEPGRTQLLLGTLPGNTAAIPTTGRRVLVDGVEWREISFRDGSGWVDAGFLKIVTEPPKTVPLPDAGATTVGIVPMTSVQDRITLRAEPGNDQASVGTVGSSVVNVTATGRTAQVGTQLWSEITTASGTTGWIETQLTTPFPRSAQEVISSGGVAAVTIDKVNVDQDGTVSVVIGGQTVTTTPIATVVTASGTQSSIADWANTAKSATGSIRVEVNVASGRITRIWLA